MSRPLKVDKHGKLALLEADVTQQCVDWLRAEGWTCIRRHVGTFQASSGRTITIGEAGDPDWLVYKMNEDVPGCAYLFHMEVKAPGGRIRKEQQIRIVWLRIDEQAVCVPRSLEYLHSWMAERGWR